VSLLHPQRFVSPPETISDLLRNDRRWHLVRGEILSLTPPGARPVSLPLDLPSENLNGAVLARADIEELEPFVRPRLLTLERGRDFFIADASAPNVNVALVRVADDQGRLHPDVELHLGTPFSQHTLQTDPHAVNAFVRLVRAGDPIYVLGRARLDQDQLAMGELAGLRDAPLTPRFGGDLGPLHLYDELAFRRIAAWYALPWYRKLSLLVRNR
jgi:hypothetical protein